VSLLQINGFRNSAEIFPVHWKRNLFFRKNFGAFVDGRSLFRGFSAAQGTKPKSHAAATPVSATAESNASRINAG
jgi:hypothetical protein